MKSIILKNTVIFLVTVFLFSSCENLLEESPKSSFTAEDYFTDAATLEAGVVGMFSAAVDLYVINTNTPIFMTVLGTDEAQYRASNTNIRATVDRYNFTSSEECVREYWGRYYTLIARANTIIDKGQEIKNIDENDRNRLIANAKFIRAWSYFHLVQVFGGVPLNINYLESFDFGKPRSSVNDVYKLIVSDLVFCSQEGVLPTTIKDGFVNHWAAKTLLGKVYLTMASAKEANKVGGYAEIESTTKELYKKAMDELGGVISTSGRSLLPVYGDVFKIENKNINSESIWELQFSSIQPYGTQWAKEFGCASTGYSGTAAGWRFNAIAGQANITYVPSFRSYYNTNGYDKRRDWNLKDSLVVFNGSTGLPTSIRHMTTTSSKPIPGDNSSSACCTYSGITKYRWGKKWSDMTTYNYSNLPNNIIALRYADVLLMYAEADLKYNDGTASPAGLNAINQVIQRARGLNSSGVPISSSSTPGFNNYTSGTLTIDEILKERARELCFEGWRWFDLARTGKFEQFLAARNAPTSYIPTNFQSNRNYLFPIPQKEIDISTNKEGMYQNPNY